MYSRFLFLSSFLQRVSLFPLIICCHFSCHILQFCFFFLTCCNVRFISQSGFTSPVLFVFVISLYCNVSLYFVFPSSFVVTFLHGFLSFLFFCLVVVVFFFLAILIFHGIINTSIIYFSPSITLFSFFSVVSQEVYGLFWSCSVIVSTKFSLFLSCFFLIILLCFVLGIFISVLSFSSHKSVFFFTYE